MICYMQKQILRIRLLSSFWQIRFLSSTDSESLHNVSVPKSSFTVQYLVNSLGIPLKSAVSVSERFQLEEKKADKHESVVSLFRSRQFSDTQIAKVVCKYPHILQSKIDNNLKPKFEFLEGIGLVWPLLPKLIARNPTILLRSLSDNLEPAIEFLRKYLGTDDRVVAALRRDPWLLTYGEKVIEPNVNCLLRAGVSASGIGKLISIQPRVIMQKVDRMTYAVEAVKKLGIEPSSLIFIKCVKVMLSLSDATLKNKMEIFKSLGWSEEDIICAFKRQPCFLACSEEKIRSAMDFYVNTMKLNLDVIVAYPKLLQYSLNARVRPMYNVLEFLLSKKLLKEDKKLVWILTLSEKDFICTYVDKHLEQFPGLIELYPGAVSGGKK